VSLFDLKIGFRLRILDWELDLNFNSDKENQQEKAESKNPD
jgi:hypothetical protein